MDALQNIITLMEQQNCDNQTLASVLGLNRQVVTDWKAGRSKSYQKYLSQIADYFGVSVDELLGKPTPKPSASVARIISDFQLTEHEKALIFAYREQPGMRSAVDKLLGIADDAGVILYAAAHSKDRHDDGIVRKSQAQWQKIEQSPDTDDSLL